jgi:alkanesulfonate monooxygenase SsuD/methylene tetrahydromethanopterin reductase-like flavin-dependent oxidoreductase (luciferase family)
VLFGGGGPVSLERAARCGDGWFGAAPGWDGTDEVISSQTVTFRDHWSRLGREPQPIVGVLQPVPGWLADVGKPAAVLRTRFSRYRELGIDQLVLTINWAEPAKAHRLLAAAARAHATL